MTSRTNDNAESCDVIELSSDSSDSSKEIVPQPTSCNVIEISSDSSDSSEEIVPQPTNLRYCSYVTAYMCNMYM